MSGTAVFVPGSPLLLPDVGGSADPGRELRERAVHTVRTAITDAARVEVVVASDRGTDNYNAPFPLFRLTGARRTGPRIDAPEHNGGQRTEPVGAAVARSVLAEAGWSGPVRVRPVDVHDHHPGSGSSDDGTVVIMVGDGSALRREGGPDVVRQDALEFDAALLAAIGAGDTGALENLCADPSSAASMFVTGLPVWADLARAIPAGTPITATIDYSGDPFGVFTIIGTWRW